MEKPSKVEVGQRFEGSPGNIYAITAVHGDTTSWRFEPSGATGDGTDCELWLEPHWKFLGYAPGYGPTPDPPKDEERCPCGNEWRAPSTPWQMEYICTVGGDEVGTSRYRRCAKPAAAVSECHHARCTEHAPKAFRAAPVLSPEAIAKGKDAIRRLTEKTATAPKPSPAPVPAAEAPKTSPPKPSPDTCTVSTCSLGEKCVTCNPKKPEPFYPAVDDFDLLPDA